MFFGRWLIAEVEVDAAVPGTSLEISNIFRTFDTTVSPLSAD